MAECAHKFTFLRSEKTNIGFPRNPTYLHEDVYFCEKCLTYQRKKLRETRPSSESFYEEHVVATYNEAGVRLG